jgi:hypothetical protein
MFIEKIKEQLILINVHAIMLATEKEYPSYRFYVKNGFSQLEGLCFLAIGF